mmetsp:Transcript_11114/g.21796  ORF Transcript_11114/g.21796 Transcript_11114/m.21796 type:complete len:83 (+) Transcript_11114:533-781(+)
MPWQKTQATCLKYIKKLFYLPDLNHPQNFLNTSRLHLSFMASFPWNVQDTPGKSNNLLKPFPSRTGSQRTLRIRGLCSRTVE